MHTFLGIHFKMMFASDGGLICFVNITQRISQAWGWQVWECSTDHSALDHGECWTDEAGAKLVAIYESDLQRVQTSFTPSKFLYETYACQGFLLVIANNQELDAYYREDLIWLNDLSTKTWTCFQHLQRRWQLRETTVFCVSFDGMPFLGAQGRIGTKLTVEKFMANDAQLYRSFIYGHS